MFVRVCARLSESAGGERVCVLKGDDLFCSFLLLNPLVNPKSIRILGVLVLVCVPPVSSVSYLPPVSTVVLVLLPVSSVILFVPPVSSVSASWCTAC